MASVVTQVTAPAFPGAGQPVGTGTGQANALPINPAHRALPVVPDIPETLQDPPEELLDMHKQLTDAVAAAKRENSTNFYNKGHDLRLQTTDKDSVVFGTIRKNIDALESIGHPCNLKERLERGGVGHYYSKPIPETIPVSPDNVDEDMCRQIRAQGCKGDNFTKTEGRQSSRSFNVATGPIVRRAKAKKRHEEIVAWKADEKHQVVEVEQVLDRNKRKIAELEAENAKAEKVIKNKKANIAAVEKVADELLVNSEELFKIDESRAQQTIIGLNCMSGSTRSGILEPLGLYPGSKDYKAVTFDKVVDAVVHTLVGNDLVKKFTARREIIAWADTMPEAIKAELQAKLAGAGSSGD